MVNCRFCGEEIVPTSKFCNHCGRELRVPQQTPQQVPEKRLSPWIVALVIIVVGILIIATISLWPKSNPKDDKDSDGDGYPDSQDDFPNDPNYHLTYSLVNSEDFHLDSSLSEICAGVDFPFGSRCWDWSFDANTKLIQWRWRAEDWIVFRFIEYTGTSYRTLYQDTGIFDSDGQFVSGAGRYGFVMIINDPGENDRVKVNYFYANGVD